MQPAQFLEVGSIFAKDFRIVRVVAQGGMGAVYEAEQLDDQRHVALKLMHPSQVSDPKLRKRFAQEARVGAWIGSEHIVEVYRAGVDEVTHFPWLSMELLKGETLATRIGRYLPAQGLPHDEAWKVLSQLCRALIAAHEKGVVHRDLKPENVFLTTQPRTDAPFTVKVLDFGIAKRLSATDRAQNRTTAIGTPLWMSPEQNEDTEITPAADVWAFGLLFFRMFTGRFYWLSANEPDLNLGWLYSELVSEALVPATYRADVLGCLHLLPPNIDAWFTRCVARDPKARFASAREMTEALAAVAPPSFAPLGRSSLAPMRASSPEVAQATVMMSSPPQAPVSATIAMAAPPPGMMQHAPQFAPPPASSPARSKSAMVFVGLGVAVLAGLGVAAALWFGSSSQNASSSREAQPSPPPMADAPMQQPQVQPPVQPQQGVTQFPAVVPQAPVEAMPAMPSPISPSPVLTGTPSTVRRRDGTK
ncbi:MAG: protein kinase [Polyangiales bacterium]